MTTSTGREWRPRLALLLAGTIVGVTLLEAALRCWTHASVAVANVFRDWDPMGYQIELLGDAYRPRPGAMFHYANHTIAHENSRGYRGPEVRVPKPPGTFRIIILGGSTTHGFGVDDEDTIDALLRPLLAQQHPGRSFEVVNLGFDSYDSSCDFIRLQADGLPLDPDAVIVHSGINDAPAARLQPPPAEPSYAFRQRLKPLLEQQRRGGPSAWDRLKHRLLAARVPGMLKHALLQTVHHTSGAPVPMSGPGTPPLTAGDPFERNLRRIANLTGPGVILLFSPPPSVLGFPPPLPPIFPGNLIVDPATTQRYRDALDARMRRVAAELAATGRRVAYVPHQLPVERFLDDCHLDREGNRLVAVDFAEALRPWLQ